jgi:hypothetical protein
MTRFPFDWTLANKIKAHTNGRAYPRGHVVIVDAAPMATSATALHAAEPAVATYAATSAATNFLSTAAASDTALKFTAAGTIAVNDVLIDAAAPGEAVKVLSISTVNAVVQRGYGGTTKATHLTGATWNLVGKAKAVSLKATELLATPQLVEAKANAAGCTGTVYVIGKDALGNAITDTCAVTNATAVPTTKAFSVVSEYVVPCETHAGTDTYSLGVVKSIAVPFLLSENGYATQASSMLGATYDGTTDAGTLSLDASDAAKSIYTPAGAGDGTKKLRVTLIVAKF